MSGKQQIREGHQGPHYDSSTESDIKTNGSDMSDREPTHQSSTRNHNHTLANSHQRLLDEDKLARGRSDTMGTRRPSHTSKRSTLRSRSPKYNDAKAQTRKKYLYASFFLVVSLISFVVQTETAVYIQHELHWNKAYCMLWLTHGSWSLLWPTQLLILRFQKRKLTFSNFFRRHTNVIHTTAQMVQTQSLHPASSLAVRPEHTWRYLFKVTSGVTVFLTIAGASWYVAIDMTTPSDLTAIYNCSAFFAYVFSILLLKEKARLDKILSVALAILGVLVVAYGDSGHPKHGSHSGGSTNPDHDGEPDNRALGNLIIGVGSVMYGLYEVLYKKYACPPEGTSPTRGMQFANTFGSMIGTFTLCVMWIPLPILHFTGIERFELPTGRAAWLLSISTLSNAVFSGSFLILMSLTSPVLSSVAALLTIFLVAITDYLITGKAMSGATVSGGLLIIVAFGLLSWATYRELLEEEKKRENEETKNFDQEEAMLADTGLLSDEDFSEDEIGHHSMVKSRESHGD